MGRSSTCGASGDGKFTKPKPCRFSRTPPLSSHSNACGILYKRGWCCTFCNCGAHRNAVKLSSSSTRDFFQARAAQRSPMLTPRDSPFLCCSLQEGGGRGGARRPGCPVTQAVEAIARCGRSCCGPSVISALSLGLLRRAAWPFNRPRRPAQVFDASSRCTLRSPRSAGGSRGLDSLRLLRQLGGAQRALRRAVSLFAKRQQELAAPLNSPASASIDLTYPAAFGVRPRARAGALAPPKKSGVVCVAACSCHVPSPPAILVLAAQRHYFSCACAAARRVRLTSVVSLTLQRTVGPHRRDVQVPHLQGAA